MAEMLTRENIEDWRGYLLNAHKSGSGLNGELNNSDINALCDLALSALRAHAGQGGPVRYERKFLGFWVACNKEFYDQRIDLPGIEFRALYEAPAVREAQINAGPEHESQDAATLASQEAPAGEHAPVPAPLPPASGDEAVAYIDAAEFARLRHAGQNVVAHHGRCHHLDVALYLRSSREEDRSAVTPCCGEYATCGRACTPRGVAEGLERAAKICRESAEKMEAHYSEKEEDFPTSYVVGARNEAIELESAIRRSLLPDAKR